MTPRLNQSEVFEYWKRQVREHGPSPSASWSDHRVIEMEIAEIAKHLADRDRVLDVGCANGYSSMQFGCARRIHLRGLDYVPEMIEQAKLRTGTMAGNLGGSVEFDVGDITQLKEPSDHYDKVIVVRVLINLGNWERQLRGLQESIRVLKRDGLLLLLEATLQGWRRLNVLREEWGMETFPMPAFNQYLDEEQVIAAIGGQATLLELSNFASSYYVGTRVLKPLLARATQAPVSVGDPNSEWNRWCSLLPPAGDYGTQKLFVLS